MAYRRRSSTQQQQQQRRWEPVRQAEAISSPPEDVATATQEVLLVDEPEEQNECVKEAAVEMSCAKTQADEEPCEGTDAAFAEAIVPPPGLGGIHFSPLFAPPPGLPLPPTAPTSDASGDCGAEKVEVKAVCQVCISGIPNKLLSQVMLEAIIDQAGLSDEVTDMSSKKSAVKGKTCGEVVVSLSNFAAAERCILHFEGCQWDCSGATVRCETTPLEVEIDDAGDHFAISQSGVDALAESIRELAKELAQRDDFNASFWGEKACASGSPGDEAQDAMPQRTSLAPDAPAFVPATEKGSFSANAAVFVPAAIKQKLQEDSRKLSDVSTDLGESGSDEEEEEDEKCSADDSAFIGAEPLIAF